MADMALSTKEFLEYLKNSKKGVEKIAGGLSEPGGGGYYDMK